TLREQLEQLCEEKTPDGLPRVTKDKVNEYYEKIEAVASKIVAQVSSPRFLPVCFYPLLK
ncbi:unnamed protein product, partial [Brassica oleracea]